MKKFVLGTWSISGDYGYKNENESLKILKYSYKNKIYEYDTAPNYGFGYSEHLVGNVFDKYKNILINTKIGNNHKKIKSFDLKDIEKSFFKSLSNLKKINILFLHNPRNDINYRKVIPFLKDIKKFKLINDFGLSLARNFKYNKEIINKFKIFQIDYNLFNFNINYSLNKKIIYGRSPLASGLLAKNIRLNKLKKFDHRKTWLNSNRLDEINKKKKFIQENINGKIKNSSVHFVKKSNDLDKVIFGVKTLEQIKTVIKLYKQNNNTNFIMLKNKLIDYDKKNKEVSY